MNYMNKLKSIFLATFLMLVWGAAAASAQRLYGGRVAVSGTVVERDGDIVRVAVNLSVDGEALPSNSGAVLTPMLVNGADTVKLPSAEILGRKRYIYYQRNGVTATQQPAVVALGAAGAEVNYSATAPYAPWMNGSQLVVAEGECGCDQTLLAQSVLSPLGNVDLRKDISYALAYVQPKAEAIKIRQVEGSAHLNFVIDKYDIRPSFGTNAAELRKIHETIDLVRNDSDVTIMGIELHGYASPDGPYAHNVVLAKNRTQALRQYLVDYYDRLPASLFSTQSTAEDWDSVRCLIAASQLTDRTALLAIVDCDLKPDAKDRRLAREYPEAYSYIYNKVYPLVRRTDYKVTYSVRQFSLEEAQRLIKTAPQKLSLKEMYLVANSYPTGSDDFKQVFDVAVRMFPDDETANLNAANAALQNGDRTTAERFLRNAGTSAGAQNARGVLAAMNGDTATAKQLFTEAAEKGLTAAKENLKKIRN